MTTNKLKALPPAPPESESLVAFTRRTSFSAGHTVDSTTAAVRIPGTMCNVHVEVEGHDVVGAHDALERALLLAIADVDAARERARQGGL